MKRYNIRCNRVITSGIAGRIRLIKWLSSVICICVVGFIVISTYNQKNIMRLQNNIAGEIIRFHVRANSDSDEDQELKLKVKEQVVEYIQPLLSESASISESRDILTNHISDISAVAMQTLADNGSSYNVNVYFEQSYFPMKSYGDVTFPPGMYEAFRIDIGESVGRNWWCVLYPPLCFVDATHGELPESSKEVLRNILTEDEYNAVTDDNYKIEFKYLTFLNELFQN